MPQSGFHGLVGLCTARALVARVPLAAQTAFVFGTVLGAVLPDIDLYPTVVAVLTSDAANTSEIVYAYHRSASHSVFAVLLLALLGLLAGRKPSWRWALWGLSVGCLTHEVLDIFFWFAQIDLLWPLSQGVDPYFNIVNVWNPSHKELTSGVIPNVRDAIEFAAFGLFLGSIRRIVNRQRGPGPDLVRMTWWEFSLWILFPITVVTAFYVDSATQQKIVNTPFLLAYLPYCWTRIWRYRDEIAAWCKSRATWHDWDSTVACNATMIQYPTTEGEVAEIVKRARRTGKTVRVFGAGHSWSPLVPTDGVLINLDRMTTPPEIDKPNRRATVHGGMRLRDIGPLLQKHGLTLKNAGAITPQSIAGAAGSGTHGTGLEFGVIGTQFSAVRIVDGEGNLRDFNAVDHPHEMAALRLGLGCLGVVVRVTLDVVEDYSVELVTSTMSLDEFLDTFDELNSKNERVRAYWLPGSKRVAVHTMNRTDKPSKPGSVYSWFDAVFARRIVLGALWWFGRTFLVTLPTCNRILEFLGYRSTKVVGRCFDAITTPIPPFHQEAEVAVPLERAKEAVKEYRNFVMEKRYPVNVPSEIRFVKGDDVLLSPGYQQDTCYIGGYNAIYRDHDPFFEDFCTELCVRIGGRPHWGKLGAPTRDEAQRQFPGFAAFEKIRAELDPHAVFANEYIRELFNL